MIDSKMRQFVQSYINIDTKINDLWNLCSILKSTYGEDAGKINIRDLFRLAVEPKPVELTVPQQPIGLGVQAKCDPGMVAENVIRDRERKIEDTYAKCVTQLMDTLTRVFGETSFTARDVINRKCYIQDAFTGAGLPVETVIKDWSVMTVVGVLRKLPLYDVGGYLYRVKSPSFEKAREAQAARNPPSPRKWDTIDTKGIEKKSPPMKNSFHTAESYNNIAERIFVHFGRDFTIDGVNDELNAQITGDDFARIRNTKPLKGHIRRVGTSGNNGVWRIV